VLLRYDEFGPRHFAHGDNLVIELLLRRSSAEATLNVHDFGRNKTLALKPDRGPGDAPFGNRNRRFFRDHSRHLGPLRPRFVYLQGPAVDFLAVKPGDRGARLVVTGEFDEAEAA